MPTDPGRPPSLEFSMGVALFGISFMVFFLVQSVVFMRGVLALSPELAGLPFSFSLLDDPAFLERMKAVQFNGDLVGLESAWSGGIGALFILLTCWLWKREQFAVLLGIRAPKVMQIFTWAALFAGLVLIIEGLSRFSPVFDTDFMETVVGSTTNLPLLFIGVAILGPLFEELLLRGLLFGAVRHIADEHVSVAVTAGVFALMHLQYSLPIMLLILPMGIVLGYARARTGSLLVPIVLHMANNGLSIIWP
ncbi:MAG: type II CAAX endopeptidase family protein [Flavobacteriales bacterium]